MLRYGRTVKVTRGVWNRTPDRYRFQWFRNEIEIPGATRQTYRLGVADVGQRIKARVYVKKRGYEWAQATARGEGRVGYRVAGAPYRHLPHRDPRPHHHQRA